MARTPPGPAQTHAAQDANAPSVQAAPAAHGLRAHTPLIGPPLAPPLYLPGSPFGGFHHLSYQHYLATEQDRNAPEQAGPMPPLDAFGLVSE